MTLKTGEALARITDKTRRRVISKLKMTSPSAATLTTSISGVWATGGDVTGVPSRLTTVLSAMLQFWVVLREGRLKVRSRWSLRLKVGPFFCDTVCMHAINGDHAVFRVSLQSTSLNPTPFTGHLPLTPSENAAIDGIAGSDLLDLLGYYDNVLRPPLRCSFYNTLLPMALRDRTRSKPLGSASSDCWQLGDEPTRIRHALWYYTIGSTRTP